MPYVFADPLKVATGGGAVQPTGLDQAINAVAAAAYKSGGQILPIALDLENEPFVTTERPCYGLSQVADGDLDQAVRHRAKTRPAWPRHLHQPDWWQACTGNSTAFSGDPLWIADYGVSQPRRSRPAGPATRSGSTRTAAPSTGSPAPADLDSLLAPTVSTTSVGTGGSSQIADAELAGAGQPVSYTAAGRCRPASR